MVQGITPIVKNLLILNVGLFLITAFAGNELAYHLVLFDFHSPLFKPYQLLTFIFMHGSFMHLFGNMFTLFMFGPYLERLWGSNKFLIYYLATGIGSGLLYALINYYNYTGGTSILFGASGAVFGILFAFAYIFPNIELMLIFLPIPIKAKYFVMLYGAYELFAEFNRHPDDNIAHLAHLAGILIGFIIITIWRKKGDSYGGY